MKPMDYRILQRAMSLMPFQNMYYTTMVQKPLRPLFPKEAPEILDGTPLPTVMLITGIASPEHMIADFEGRCKKIVPMTFPDHHPFTASDVEAINMQFRMMEKPAIIITTEKDGVRLANTVGLSDSVRRALYVQPIEVQFIQDEEKFIGQITKYVRKNNRYGSMAQSAPRRPSIAVPRPTPQPRVEQPRPAVSQPKVEQPRPTQQPDVLQRKEEQVLPSGPQRVPDAKDGNNSGNGTGTSGTGNQGRTGIPIQRNPTFPGFDS